MLIALHQIVFGGQAQRVLVNANSMYVQGTRDGYTLVATIIGTILVRETPEEIEQKVSSKTQGRICDAD